MKLTRAEEAALKAYPPLSVASVCLDGTAPVDLNTGARKRFIEGYEQAEKDLALKLEDIAIIEKLFWEVVPMSREAYYTEVLTRFKQYKEASND